VIDRVLRGSIAAFAAALPGRLRCFVVAGALDGLANADADLARQTAREAQAALATLDSSRRTHPPG
jgi:hypothetical protein